ncbi:MAG: alpha/beta hydrolase family protein [Candidatus Methylomirabilis sp.]|nr:alpha/beta hydrolase family protein [Deltaproteobacteria bacterium]
MDRRTAHLLDDVAGKVAGVMHSLIRSHPDTVEELPKLQGLSQETLFPAPKGIAEVRFRKRWTLGGLVCEDIAFESEHRPLLDSFARRHAEEYRANHHVHARMLRHVGGRRRPTLLYLHGWMQPPAFFDEVSLLPMMARRLDANVIYMALPYHGKRKIPGFFWYGEYFLTSDLVRTLEAVRQSVLDARCLFEWLLHEGHGPVGAGGLSLGGSLALVLGCVEPRLAFLIPIVANLDLAGALMEAPIFHRIRRDLRDRGWSANKIQEFLEGVGWNDLKPKVPKERMLFIAAEHDKYVTPESMRAFWEAWGRPAIHWFPGGHTGFIPYAWDWVGAMRRFLSGLDMRAATNGSGAA